MYFQDEHIYEKRRFSKKDNNKNRKESGNNSYQNQGYSFSDFLSDVGNQGIRELFEGAQAKMKTNEPGDKYEQEADRIAKDIVNNKPDEDQKISTFHTTENAGIHTISGDKESKINSLTGKGSRLDNKIKKYFAPWSGVNLNDVKVHTDSNANELAESINAKAFTVRNSIFFGANQYKPETKEGQELIVHELVHIVQQDGGNEQTVQMKEEKPSTVTQEQDEPKIENGYCEFWDGSKVSLKAVVSACGDVYGDDRFKLYDELAPVGENELKDLGIEQNIFNNVKSGFKSKLYKTVEDKYIYVFAGTDWASEKDKYYDIVSGQYLSKNDMDNNLKQGAGFISKQYEIARQNVRSIAISVGKNNLLLAGHSLGGGLAAASGTINGVKAVTFNAAGVNFMTLWRRYKAGFEKAKEYVIAYDLEGDFLTYVQEQEFQGVIPEAIGVRIKLLCSRGEMPKDKKQWKKEAMDRHGSFEELIKGLELFYGW